MKKALTHKCTIVRYALTGAIFTATDFNASNANQYLIDLENEGIIKLVYVKDSTKFRQLADRKKALDFLSRYDNKKPMLN